MSPVELESCRCGVWVRGDPSEEILNENVEEGGSGRGVPRIVLAAVGLPALVRIRPFIGPKTRPLTPEAWSRGWRRREEPEAVIGYRLSGRIHTRGLSRLFEFRERLDHFLATRLALV